jgi:hypothetical protein
VNNARVVYKSEPYRNMGVESHPWCVLIITENEPESSVAPEFGYLHASEFTYRFSTKSFAEQFIKTLKLAKSVHIQTMYAYH